MGSLATIWRGSCIIRGAIPQRIRDAAEQPDLPNLMLAPFFRKSPLPSPHGAA
jgi:6-phosphogluconate dehydrogenase